MRRVLRGLPKFILAFFVMMIVWTICWELFVDGKLYNCTDGDFGFEDLISLQAHNWPLKIVPQVVPDSNMNDPDTIKEGWSINGLWALWFLFFIMSVAFSVWLARMPWHRPPSAKKIGT